MKRLLLLFLSAGLFAAESSYAQYQKPAGDGGDKDFQYSVSELRTAPRYGSILLENIPDQLSPSLQRMEIEQETGDADAPRNFRVLPEVIQDKNYTARNKTETTVDTPAVISNFNGFSDSQYTPPDNAVAVGKSGYVVSAMNCNYRIYDANGKVLKQSSFFDAFKAKFPGLTSSYFDPRVIYDQTADRFILVLLYGSDQSESSILIMFSQTGNPLDGWNLYKLSGNPFNSGECMDYPNIGISNEELFITGNQFHDNLTNGYFVENAVYQIGKQEGYDGADLSYKVWRTAAGFTIVPASYGGDGNYGPGIYLVSNAWGGGNGVNLFNITNVRTDANVKLTRNAMTFPNNYANPYSTSQKGTAYALNAGDCRIKQAFYFNGTVHYVFSSNNDAGNNSIIYYGRINVAAKTVTNRAFGETGFGCCYPSMACAALSNTDAMVIIGYLKSGNSIYPEMRAVLVDKDFNFSKSIIVRKGTYFVSSNINPVRWGDYTGMSRVPTQSVTTRGQVQVYFAGAYGLGGNWTTRIAKIGFIDPNADTTTITNPNGGGTTTTSFKGDLYPNPIAFDSRLNIKIDTTSIELDKNGTLEVSLYDMRGRQVATLYKGIQQAGLIQFTFNEAALAKGAYALIVSNNDKILLRKVLVVSGQTAAGN